MHCIIAINNAMMGFSSWHRKASKQLCKVADLTSKSASMTISPSQFHELLGRSLPPVDALTIDSLDVDDGRNLKARTRYTST